MRCVGFAWQWGDQTAYIKSAWGCGDFLAFAFVVFNLVFQLVPCAAILLKNEDKMIVRAGVFALGTVMVTQTIAYTVLWNASFFARNLAVGGSLVLVYAETAMESKNMFAGLPSAGGAGTADYLQVVGRGMVIVMFLTMFKFDSFGAILFEVVGLILMLAVAAGFRAKISALLLVILLTMQNFWSNFYWSEPSGSAVYDFKKYDFFQTLSVIGGLLLVVAYGPGGIAMDERKKDF